MSISNSSGSSKILCVNALENEQLRKAVSLVLTDVNPPLEIREFKTGDQLLESVHELGCDLILLDFYAASAQGFKLLAGLSGRCSGKPILVVCDYIEDIAMARMREYNVRAFIAETSLYADLKLALAAVLSGQPFTSKFS